MRNVSILLNSLLLLGNAGGILNVGSEGNSKKIGWPVL